MSNPALSDLAWLTRTLCQTAVHHQQDDGTLVSIVPYPTMLRLERWLDDYDAGRKPTSWTRLNRRKATPKED